MNKYFTESEVMTQDFLDWLESRHLKLRTTNEVRAAWFGWKAAHDRLLEARERAAPFGYFGWREQKHMDAEGHCTVSQKAFPELEVTTPVYLHAAPADAERLAEALRNLVSEWVAIADDGDATLEDSTLGYRACANRLSATLTANSAQAQPADNELPGMWSHSDFIGGDPDERSYAERTAQPPADQILDGVDIDFAESFERKEQPPAASVTSANADMYWLDSDPEHLSFEDIPSALEYVEGDDITTVTLQRARKLSDITVPVRFNNECGNYEIDEAALAAQENPNGV